MADVLVETARKERAITENAGEVICSLDGSIQQLNSQAEQMLPYSSADLSGHSISVFFGQGDVTGGVMFDDLTGKSMQKDGAGLGLATCKAMIEGHGGSIGLESEEGKGSTFWFFVPEGGLSPGA